MKRKQNRLDQEEKELLSSFGKGEWNKVKKLNKKNSQKIGWQNIIKSP